MKIGVITPHIPGTRTAFLAKRNKLIAAQTLQPKFDMIVAWPYLGRVDIGERVRDGLQHAFAAGCDLVFIIEDDDFYSRTYLQEMTEAWLGAGKPPAIGLSDTYYYHLGVARYRLIRHAHENRSSLFTTAVTKAALECALEGDQWVDIRLWRELKGHLHAINEMKPQAMGLKHGIGICGGVGHKNYYLHDTHDVNGDFFFRATGERLNEYRLNVGVV